MPELDLLPIVELAGCRYFAENDTGDGSILNLALRSPFIRLYALNRSTEVLVAQRQRFADNERVQLFNWTHPGCWTELVKLVPMDQPSVFWMHPTENVGQALITIGQLRPARQDVLLFEVGQLRGILPMAERHFSRTHKVGVWIGHQSSDMNYNEMKWSDFLLEPDQPPIYMLFPRRV